MTSLLEVPPRRLRRADRSCWSRLRRGRPAVRRPRLLAGARRAGGRRSPRSSPPPATARRRCCGEWCARDPRPAAWLTLGAPARGPAAAPARDRPRGGPRRRPARRDGRIVLVIDDVQWCARRAARETLAGIGPASAGGHDHRARLARRAAAAGGPPAGRGPGRELRAADAGDDPRRGGRAVPRAGLRLDARAAGRARCGAPRAGRSRWRWRAGAGAAGAPGASTAATGSIADYLRDEILAELGDGSASSCLGDLDPRALTGALCDAVLERADSAAGSRGSARGRPARRARPPGERYRHHRLLADLLRRELRRAAPGARAGAATGGRAGGTRGPASASGRSATRWPPVTEPRGRAPADRHAGVGRARRERHGRALADPVHRRAAGGAPAAGGGRRRHAAGPRPG